MEQRFSMNLFLEEYHGKDKPEIRLFYLENNDCLYGGRELLSKDSKITYYFCPTDKRSALMFLYAGDDVFDEVVDNINEYNQEGLSNAFPLFIKALVNGANDNYYGTALIKLPHISGNGGFWCFATKVDNVDFSDLENDYVLDKLNDLLSDTLDIYKQINDNEVSLWDKLKSTGKAASDGYRIGRGILTVASIVGSVFLGVDLTGGN